MLFLEGMSEKENGIYIGNGRKLCSFILKGRFVDIILLGKMK